MKKVNKKTEDKSKEALNYIKTFLRALDFDCFINEPDISLSLSINGYISVVDNETEKKTPLSQWLKIRGIELEQFKEEISEDLETQLLERNKEFFWTIEHEQHIALLNYRYEIGYGGDDDDDERYESMFVRDMSFEGINLETLAKDLIKKGYHLRDIEIEEEEF